MTIYQTIEGQSLSETWTAHVNFPNGQPYSEIFTHSAVVPTSSSVNMQDGSSENSWKFPKLDKSSFRAIKQSGEIKMSDYDVGKIVTDNFVVRLPRKVETYVKRGAYTLTNDNKSFFNKSEHLFDLSALYQIVGDLSHLQTVFSGKPFIPLDLTSWERDKADAIDDVMEDTVVALNASYDPLTDLAELRDTLELLHTLLRSAVHPIQALRLLAAKYGRNVNKSMWEDAWMSYRYGIMPIVYSICDIIETAKRTKKAYRTVRKFRPLQLALSSQQGTGAHFFETITSTIRVNGTGKVRASDSELLRLIDNISINPFKTAWELIPFSFVVDWFINVGNFIEAQTGSLMLFAPQRSCCYAIKEQTVRSICFHDFYDDRRTLSTGPWFVNPPGQNVFERSTRAGGSYNNANYVLRRETTDSYTRRVFSPSDISLRSDVFMNWKRWVDGFILSLGNTKRLLRS